MTIYESVARSNWKKFKSIGSHTIKNGRCYCKRIVYKENDKDNYCVKLNGQILPVRLCGDYWYV